MMKNLTKSGWLVWVAVFTAIVGMIFYFITSTTGYLAGTTLNPLPVILTVVAILLACVLVGTTNKLNSIVIDLFVVASTVLLIGSFALFLLDRVRLAADVYFIPVNFPEAEEVALNLSIVGLVFYVISIISLIVVSFSDKIRK